jgi:hypothetical protein
VGLAEGWLDFRENANDIIDNYKIELERQISLEAAVRVGKIRNDDEGISPRNIEYTPSPEMRRDESGQLSEQDYGFYETGYSPEWVNSSTKTGSPQWAPDSNSPSWHPDGSPINSPQGLINIDNLLINKEPGKDWDASPPWAPPFDNPDKNDIYNQLPRYVQDNIVKLNIRDENTLFDVVIQANNKLIKEKTGFSPNTPSSVMSNGEEFTSLTPMSLGPTPQGTTPEGTPPSRGGAIIFNDPLLDSQFNKLGGAQQARILALPQNQRGGVMSEIIKRSMQGGSSTALNNEPLNDLFGRLPVHNKVLALQGGYKSMADELKTLGGRVPEITTTISKPVPMSVQLAGKFPLLAVEQKGGNKNTSESTSSTDESSSSSSSSSSDNSGGGTIKKITF